MILQGVCCEVGELFKASRHCNVLYEYQSSQIRDMLQNKATFSMHSLYSLCVIWFFLSFFDVSTHAFQSPILPSGCTQTSSALMISSIISRGQGLSGGNQSGKSTSQIELGVFQMALRNTIDLYSTRYSDCSAAWKSFLDKSLTRAAPTLLNETRDADYPLDRFAIGNALLYQCVLLFP